MSHKQDNLVLATMLAGLTSGFVGKLILHPLDTVKAKIQVKPGSTLRSASRQSLILQIFQDTYRNQGIRGLYRGMPTSVVGTIPGAALYFTTYEYVKKSTLRYEFTRNHESVSYFIAGMMAQAVACVLFVPIDVIKERLQVQSNLKTYAYRSDFDAFQQVARTEGLRGLYKAYPATVLSFGPYSALNFVFYQKFKGLLVQNDASAYLKRVDRDKDAEQRGKISGFKSFLCSIGAGILSSAITNPLDLGKLRLQVQRAGHRGGKSSSFQYKHLLHALYKITMDEGFLALFNGVLVRILYMVPMFGISMALVEELKVKYQKMLDG